MSSIYSTTAVPTAEVIPEAPRHGISDSLDGDEAISPYLAASLAYAAEGTPTFPIADKKPVFRGWQMLATTNASILQEWDRAFRPTGLAMPTGLKTNRLVIDFDVKSGGLETLRAWEKEHGRFTTRRARTAHGGIHLHFQYPSFYTSNVRNLGAGVDVRGQGGLIVLPPSTLPDGGSYEWEDESVPIGFAPDWLLDLLQERMRPGAFEPKKNVPEGGRNDYLYRMGCSLRAKGFSQGVIEAALLAENSAVCSDPVPPEEVKLIAQSASTHEAPPYLRLGDHSQGDFAEKFVLYGSEDLRYVEGMGWIAYDGGLWEEGGRGERMATRRVQDMLNEALALSKTLKADNDRDGKKTERLRSDYAKGIRRHLTLPAISSIRELAKAQRGMEVSPDALDAHDLLLNTPNGTYDLQEKNFREHRASDMLTKSTSAEYHPEATCPIWVETLEGIFEDKKDREGVIRYVQKVLGRCVSGDTSEQTGWMLEGDGRNGKSLITTTVSNVLGSYAGIVDASAFDGLQKRDGRNHDLMAHRGTRMLLTMETAEDQPLDEPRWKAMNSQEGIRGRLNYKEFFSFAPKWKLILSTNHLPRIQGTNHGIWRRLTVIPFRVRFEGTRDDTGLAAKLVAEYPGILNWLIEGYYLWKAEGLIPPREILDAMETYQSSNDLLGLFLEDRCQIDTQGPVDARPFTPNGELYTAFTTWMEEQGEKRYIQSSGSFLRKLRERRMPDTGFLLPDKVNHQRGLRGIELRPLPVGKYG